MIHRMNGGRAPGSTERLYQQRYFEQSCELCMHHAHERRVGRATCVQQQEGQASMLLW